MFSGFHLADTSHFYFKKFTDEALLTYAIFMLSVRVTFPQTFSFGKKYICTLNGYDMSKRICVRKILHTPLNFTSNGNFFFALFRGLAYHFSWWRLISSDKICWQMCNVYRVLQEKREESEKVLKAVDIRAQYFHEWMTKVWSFVLSFSFFVLSFHLYFLMCLQVSEWFVHQNNAFRKVRYRIW